MKSREQAEEILLNRGWMTYMPGAVQRDVLRRLSLREYETGQAVYRQGDELGGMFGLVAGTLCVSLAPNRHGPYSASFVKPGFWIGGGPAMSGERRRVSAAVRSRTLLAHLPLPAIRELTTADPGFWRYIATNVMLNLDTSLQRFDDLLIPDPKIRVAAVLLRLAGLYDDPHDPFANPDIPMTQSEIAEITRLSRNGLGGVLSRLAAEGMIKMGYGRITVTDAKALTRVLDDGH